ncbi:MAG: glycosyl transferase family 2 [Nodularia sp. (in: Bacteria)]|nr:MAG: glycosyl transferase family 2 [Nodularia sp. (in: cyanobacteria)]
MKNIDDFRIHGICVVKNEADIIEYCLQEAVKWADFIYILDNGSTDGTWEKVLALKSESIIPWKQDDKPFQFIRAEVFNEFRDRAKPGDWWCRLDADEFYIDHPPTFLKSVPNHCHVVWGLPIEYYLTTQDIDQIDFSVPTSELLPQIRYYRAENSEERFIRHRQNLKWPDYAPWPKHMGVVYKQRIKYKHYKYRSPEQIQKRFDTRRAAREIGYTGFKHATKQNWHEAISDPKYFNFDHNDGSYKIDWERLPRNVETLPKRCAKLLFHGLGIWP